MLKLGSSVTKLYKVGPILTKRLENLGIQRIIDLLFYFPSRHEDRSKIVEIDKLGKHLNENIVIEGKIKSLKSIYNKFRRLTIITGLLEDSTGSVEVVWYNQKFLMNSLCEGETISVYGKPKLFKSNYLQIIVNTYEKTNLRRIHTGRIVPIYKETFGLSSKLIRFYVWNILDLASSLEDYLPDHIISSQRLLSLKEAIREIHFPKNKKTLDEAKKRLSFDELFFIQLYTQSERKKWHDHKAFPLKTNHKILNQFIKSLPYEMTQSQTQAGEEILKDLSSPDPANRLLEGDVGSGKTTVAMLSLLNVVCQDYQAALLAPTDVLANQHFHKIREFFEPFNVRIGLLSAKNHLINENSFGIIGGTQPLSKNKFLEKIKNHSLDLIIGTHALLEDNIEFAKLAYLIIDEQHRFGVRQRSVLQKKFKTVPHLLTMTATPIPRTLALSVYGNLDLSVLKEMPQGRKKILTKVVANNNRLKAYDFIKKYLKKGRQAYIICPLVLDSDKIRAKAATQEFERLSKEIFPKFKMGLIHGKLKKKEKEKVMEEFYQGKIQVLVSTSVIEVGVDVPNANIIVIEGADRFGLAQLHQLRGRVGRDQYQSFCFLFTESNSPKSKERLAVLTQTLSGFELAEKDLEFRGFGNIYGHEQSGLVTNLKIASLTDYALIKQAKKEAQQILENDPNLDHYEKLKIRLKKFDFEVHFE
jgi:ATP-dependent DNA helicase RecG